MKPIPQQIESLLRQAIQSAQQSGSLPTFAIPDSVPVTPAKSPEHGDYASPVAMALAKPAAMKPLDIATAITQALPESSLLASAEAVAPGFINMRLNPDWIRAQIETIIQEGDAAFRQDIGAGKRAQVEFVSANPTGPLHIGRTRGAIIGDTLANILAACGWEVEREYYFNNAGRQMELLGKSLKARYLQELGQSASLPDEGYQGAYLVEIAQQLKGEVGEEWVNYEWQPFKEYAESQIFEMIKATLGRVGIAHDYFFNEQWVYDDNSVWETLARLREAGHIYESFWRESVTITEEETQTVLTWMEKLHEAGYSDDDLVWNRAKIERVRKAAPAMWFRSTSFEDSQDRVVVKANGDPTYVLPDIAYHINKLNRHFDRIVDVFGSDHQVEAKTVERGLTALGYDTSKVNVVLHQFVTFPEGLKMSTRAGNYVTLDDLIDDVGADVVRYFMLGRSANTKIEFDLKLAREQSRENPVYYIQNAHVRCCGIFRQLAERGLPEDWDVGADLSLLGDAEMSFVRKALELPEQLILAHDNLAPHQIAFWTLDLARIFHPLYDEVRVLHSDVPDEVAKARLRFYRMAQVTFAYALKLMGMSAPERM